MGDWVGNLSKIAYREGFIKVTNWRPTQWLIQVKLLRVVMIILLDWISIIFQSIGDKVIEIHNSDTQKSSYL